MSVTRFGLSFENAIHGRQEGHVEGAVTHIIEQHLVLVVSFLVQSVGDRSRYLIADG